MSRSRIGRGRRSRFRGYVSAYLVRCLVTGHGYIGITVQDPTKRWLDHCRIALKTTSQTRFHRAIRKYGAAVFTVEHIASTRTWDDACVVERTLIAQWGTFGSNGYNLTRGGDGSFGVVQSAESIAKRSAASKGRKLTPEHIRKSVEGQKASWTPERRARVSEQARLRMSDPAYKANLLASHSTPEYRAKMGNKARGRKQSPEQRAKLSAVRRGRKQSPELIERRIAPLRGRKRKIVVELVAAQAAFNWDTQSKGG